jgi:hypothetical protein
MFMEQHAMRWIVQSIQNVDDRVWGLSRSFDDDSLHRIHMIASLSWPFSLANPATASFVPDQLDLLLTGHISPLDMFLQDQT